MDAAGGGHVDPPKHHTHEDSLYEDLDQQRHGSRRELKPPIWRYEPGAPGYTKSSSSPSLRQIALTVPHASGVATSSVKKGYFFVTPSACLEKQAPVRICLPKLVLISSYLQPWLLHRCLFNSSRVGLGGEGIFRLDVGSYTLRYEPGSARGRKETARTRTRPLYRPKQPPQPLRLSSSKSRELGSHSEDLRLHGTTQTKPKRYEQRQPWSYLDRPDRIRGDGRPKHLLRSTGESCSLSPPKLLVNLALEGWLPCRFRSK